MKQKEERLDEILMRLGYVTEDELKQALLRQKAHGGRLGSHLLYFKFISEDELVQALSAQYDVPGFRLDEHDISRKAVKTLPLEVAEDHQVLPIDFDKKKSVLKLAVVDPTDQKMLHRAKKAFGAKTVKMYIAPESLMRMLTTQYYRGQSRNPEVTSIVELPELFSETPLAEGDASERPKEPNRPRVLMFTKTTSLRNFLAPIFEREGILLDVASSEEELGALLKQQQYRQVLVSHDAHEQFARYRSTNARGLGETETTVFPSVSGVFLENPVPYHRITRSLFRSLQVIAEQRCRDYGWTPPYVLICSDIQQLARAFGFSRLATDGLQIAAYLLIPEVTGGARRTGLSFVDFDRSLDIAKSLHFPWNVQGVLKHFIDLLGGGRKNNGKDGNDEVKRAAQILAIVWYYRLALSTNHKDKKVGAGARSRLRDQGGKLVELDVIEAYIRLLEHNREESEPRFNQIFLVSETDEMHEHFVSRLNRAGFHTVQIRSMEEAKQLCDRHPPAAIVIDRECFPQKIMQASGMFKLNGIVLLYAYTRDPEPSLTLDLLDAGYDDVFAQPHDYDVITARISKSLRGLMRKGGTNQGGFSANFKAFSFIDLMQTLGQSVKTVRIDLTNSAGAGATIFLERGRMTHAICGGVSGEEAIYQVIRWGDDGSFSVEPVDEVPEPNISESNEGILMEGCRLLDESRI
jgi:DNA-binding response OmpR family regulator